MEEEKLAETAVIIQPKSAKIGLIALIVKLGPKFLSILGKFLKVLPKLFKATKALKVAGAAGSVAAYSYLFSWQMGVAICVLLLVHEYGHIWAMKRCGIKTKGIYFIPFLGAAAVAEEDFKSRANEAYISMMGPIFGLFVFGGTFLLYLISHNIIFLAILTFIAFIQVFNLLPINPLDGGRLVKSVAFSIRTKLGIWFMVLSSALAIFLALKLGLALLVIIGIIGILETILELRNKKKAEQIADEMKDIDPPEQAIEKLKYGVNLDGLDGEIKDRVAKIIVDPELKQRIEEIYQERMQIINTFLKPSMSTEQIFQYSGLFVGLIIVNLLVVVCAASVPGCSEALKMLK
jgi:Zn-dependent protease